MSYIIDLEHYDDVRGSLTVIDHVLPFEIKRSYYITKVNQLDRGGHRHMVLVEAIICLNGSFIVTIHDGTKKEEILLDSPHKCLIIEVGEWHKFSEFSQGAVLLSLASTHYDKTDYIYEPYD